LQEERKYIDLLIARYLTGEASEAEKQELTQWMEYNETNRKYFEGICFAEQHAVASHRIEKVNVEQAWQKVHQQMKVGQMDVASPKKRTASILPLWIRVAAIVVLVSGISILLYNQRNNAPVKYNTVATTTTNISLNYTLSDSSVISLNQHSQIACASNFGKKERRVKLTGEAFFEVKHDAGKPFIVESSGTFIKVTGTSFNIKGNEPDSLVEVYVKTGSVLFFTSNKEGITLVAGETGVYNKNQGTFTKTKEANSNTTAYTNRVFVFYNTTLNEVFKQLNKVYGVTIVPANEQLGLCTITVSFNDDELETILNIIAETLNLEYWSDGQNRYIFEGKASISGEKIP
jgi:transmembrane sensor